MSRKLDAILRGSPAPAWFATDRRHREGPHARARPIGRAVVSAAPPSAHHTRKDVALRRHRRRASLPAKTPATTAAHIAT